MRWRLRHLALALLAWPAAPAAQAMCWALLADGTLVVGDRIAGWDSRRRPTLGGRRLLDPSNPMLLVRMAGPREALTGPWVEFRNGDVLAARVVRYEAFEKLHDKPMALALLPTGLAHKPYATVKGPTSLKGMIYVRPEFVRRISWGGHSGGEYRPGTLVLKEGQSLRVQAVRWTGDGVRVLTDAGVVAHRFAELQQIDLPSPRPGEVGPIQALLADLTAPGPANDGMIGRFTLEEGTSVTCRLSSLGPGSSLDHNSGFAMHPAWALCGLRIAADNIRGLTCWSHDEIPLSLLPARTVAERSFLGHHWPWRRNRNVRNQTLTAGPVISDLGVGMHSYSAVAFALPTGARELCFLAGMDYSVAGGGCVTLKVYKDDLSGKPVWASGFLQGSDGLIRVGPVPCDGARELILVTDFGHDGRPAGADPGDIRDHVNWIAPLVRLDPALVERAVRGAQWAPFDLAGWTVARGGDDKLIAVTWDKRLWRWEPILHVPVTGLTLKRRLRVSDGPAKLTARADGTQGPLAATLSAGEQALKVVKLSRRPGETGSGYSWNLEEHRGKEIEVSLAMQPKDRRPKMLQSLRIRGEGVQALPWQDTVVVKPPPIKPPAPPAPPSATQPVRPPAAPGPGLEGGEANLIVEASAGQYSVEISSAGIRRDSDGKMTMRFLDVRPGAHTVHLAGPDVRLTCRIEMRKGARILIAANFASQTATVETVLGAEKTLSVFPGQRGKEMALARIPAGTFVMGSPADEPGRGEDEGPPHEVRISRAFYLGRTEVTAAQMRDYERDVPADQRGPVHRGGLRPPKVHMKTYPGFPHSAKDPAAGVSWEEAKDYCDWLARKTGRIVRLPTEAEWEYACRAGTTTAYCWGNDAAKGKGHCNVADLSARRKFRTWTVFPWTDGFVYVSPAGKYVPNAWGLYDMHGNVWEWCWDWHDAKYYAQSPRVDPTGPDQGERRVLRGGSWSSGPRSARSASRMSGAPYDKDLKNGFRVLIEAQ